MIIRSSETFFEDFFYSYEIKDEFINLYYQCILFLNTLVEGEPDPQVLQTMKEFLQTDELLEDTTNVYKKLIEGKEKV